MLNLFHAHTKLSCYSPPLPLQFGGPTRLCFLRMRVSGIARRAGAARTNLSKTTVLVSKTSGHQTQHHLLFFVVLATWRITLCMMRLAKDRSDPSFRPLERKIERYDRHWQKNATTFPSAHHTPCTFLPSDLNLELDWWCRLFSFINWNSAGCNQNIIPEIPWLDCCSHHAGISSHRRFTKRIQ